MNLWKKTILALGFTAMLASGAQTSYAYTVYEGEASNASGANDTLSTAVMYHVGDVMNGVVGTTGDVDMYKFALDDDQVLRFTFDTTGTYEFAIYDGAGGLVGSVVGSGYLDVPVDYTADLYSIRVSGKNDSGDAYTIFAKPMGRG